MAVAAGRSHTVGLKADGTVIAVGLNNWGQCNVRSWDLGATQADGFGGWTIARRLPVLLRGPADRNGPLGLPNLVAYALGLNPLTAQPQDLPSLTLRETGGVVTVALTYRRSKTATGIDLQVIGAAALRSGPWEPANGTPVKLGDTADGQAELWQMEFPADVPAGFFQLRVTQP